jgi:hypothetical protein
MDEGWGECNAASGGGDKWGHRTHHSLRRRLLHTSPLRGGPTTRLLCAIASLLERESAASGWGRGLTPPGALKGARPPPHQGEGWSLLRRSGKTYTWSAECQKQDIKTEHMVAAEIGLLF